MRKKTARKTNYSYKTSLPAYLENKEGKAAQEKIIAYVISRHKGGKASLKEIQDYMRNVVRLPLPQSTISGRVNDLKDKGRVAFYGEMKIYKGRLRKVFELRKNSKSRTKPKLKVVGKRRKKKIHFTLKKPIGFPLALQLPICGSQEKNRNVSKNKEDVNCRNCKKILKQITENKRRKHG